MDAIETPNIVEYFAQRLGLSRYLQPDLLGGILILLAILAGGAMAVRRWRNPPAPTQNILELLIESINGLSLQIVGPAGPRFITLFATLFLFILCANLIGLLPGFKSPTANFNINAGLALTVTLAASVVRLREHGLAGYIRHFCGPPYWLAPLFIVIRVMEEVIRPLSLTMRLFGNIMAKEIILSILIYLLTLFFFADDVFSKILLPVPLILRPLIILLGVLVSFVQALVFTGLSMVYVGEAVNEH